MNPVDKEGRDVPCDLRSVVLRLFGQLAESRDREFAHVEADKLLLKLLADDEVSEAFNAIPKWYA